VLIIGYARNVQTNGFFNELLNLGAIQFALFALGVRERASPSVALNGFWNSFGSTGLMLAFVLLAIVNLVMYWDTNVQCHGESDPTTKDAPG
jgi:hypothetical protein